MRGFYWLLIAIIATAAVAVACNDNGDGNGDETPGATQDAGAGDGETPEATADDDDRGDNGNGGALSDAIGRFERSSFVATYTATDTDPDSPLSGTVRMYKDGADRFRMDITGTFEGQESTFIIIETPDASGFCIAGAGELSELFGVPEGEDGVCFESDPTGDTGFGSLADELREFDAGNFEVLQAESREIAGRDADCFTMRERGEDDVQEICIDDDGVLLYVSTEGDDTTTIEASDVGGDPGDDDFELPYTVQEFPGFGGQ